MHNLFSTPRTEMTGQSRVPFPLPPEKRFLSVRLSKSAVLSTPFLRYRDLKCVLHMHPWFFNLTLPKVFLLVFPLPAALFCKPSIHKPCSCNTLFISFGSPIKCTGRKAAVPSDKLEKPADRDGDSDGDGTAAKARTGRLWQIQDNSNQ